MELIFKSGITTSSVSKYFEAEKSAVLWGGVTILLACGWIKTEEWMPSTEKEELFFADEILSTADLFAVKANKKTIENVIKINVFRIQFILQM